MNRIILCIFAILVPFLSVAQTVKNKNKIETMVKTFVELEKAVLRGETDIVVENSIVAPYSIILPPNVTMRGKSQGGNKPLLSFSSGDGIGITTGNTIKDLAISTRPNQKAIYTTLSEEDLGEFSFQNLVLTGQFSFIMRKGSKKASVKADKVDVVFSDSRMHPEQPQKYGVNVLQGAFTVYNFSKDKDSQLNLIAQNISVGRENAPVMGSGIYIAGGGDNGGWVNVEKLHTLSVYSNGFLPENTSTYITGGVFILNGAKAREVITDGVVYTYGTNDMVLDVWGEVENWVSNKPIVSFGASSIGFVNFGVVKNFEIKAPLITYGAGSRGYNQYDGTVENITFDSIETFGNGSVGVQISKRIGKLTIKKDLKTHGSIGNSLVKGVNVELPAIALSIKDGGEAENITIGGNVETYGDGVITYNKEKGGQVHRLVVGGEIIAKGKKSQKQVIED